MVVSIAYLQGDATCPAAEGARILAHVCNDEGKWGAGFVLAVSRRWKEPEEKYREWFRREPKPQLGQVQFVDVAAGLTVANMIGQHGVRRGKAGPPPIRYDALATALRTVAEAASARTATVHMPRIGAGLAGGNWEEIEPLIKDALVSQGIEVFVYDLANTARKRSVA
jgi:O-acetyl-ADP-ribose deacetylase (regulator of RNase III)